MTRQVTALAGSDNVCSICGDEEANDYKVKQLSDTIRLCGDCLVIQEEDRFVKLA